MANTAAVPALTAQATEHAIEPLVTDEAVKERTKLRITAIMTALYLVLFIAALDLSVVATAIPSISGALHSATGYTWIGGAYLLAAAAAAPIWSKYSDIWGRRPALFGAASLFAVASLIAALSTNMPMLIATRAMQGTAGGGVSQLVTITIADLFSVRRRAFHYGLLGFVWVVAASGGPLVSGAWRERGIMQRQHCYGRKKGQTRGAA